MRNGPFCLLGTALTRLQVTDKSPGIPERCRAVTWSGSEWISPVEPVDAYFVPPTVGGGRYVDPVSLAAVAAARLVKNAGCLVKPERVGCVLGTRSGNAYTVAQCEVALRGGRRMSPILFSHAGWNVPVALVAAELNAHGFTSTLCGGLHSGNEVLRSALMALERGRADQIVVFVASLQPISEPDESLVRFEAACLAGLLGRGANGSAENCDRTSFSSMTLSDEKPLPPEIPEFAAALASFSTLEPVI